jgi:hypothetical protein
MIHPFQRDPEKWEYAFSPSPWGGERHRDRDIEIDQQDSERYRESEIGRYRVSCQL